MILLPTELPKFAPSVTLTGDALEGAILFVQSLVESDLGSNRPLEPQKYNFTKTIYIKFQRFRLQYLPVLELPDPLKIEVRIGNVLDAFRRPIVASEWMELTEDDYTLGVDGEVNLSLNYTAPRYGGTSYGGYYNTLPTPYTEAKVEYYSGIDFTQNTPEVNRLKATFGKILEFTLSSGSFKGVQELEVPFDEFRIKYATGAIGAIPESFMLPFRKYRPLSL